MDLVDQTDFDDGEKFLVPENIFNLNEERKSEKTNVICIDGKLSSQDSRLPMNSD